MWVATRDQSDQDETVSPDTEYQACHAIVDSPAWTRTGNSSQCGRSGFQCKDLAGAVLCWQHAEKARKGDEVWLVGQRLLIANIQWLESGRLIYRHARIVSNVVNLSHLLRDQPPPGWEPVTMEDLREAAEKLCEILTPHATSQE